MSIQNLLSYTFTVIQNLRSYRIYCLTHLLSYAVLLDVIPEFTVTQNQRLLKFIHSRITVTPNPEFTVGHLIIEISEFTAGYCVCVIVFLRLFLHTGIFGFSVILGCLFEIAIIPDSALLV